MIGLDLGYNGVKVVTRNIRATFPSAVGSADAARFSLGSQENPTLTYKGESFFYGTHAVDESTFVTRREDREWIDSQVYDQLIVAAFYEAMRQDDATARVYPVLVTGLPVMFYDADKENLVSKFRGPFVFEDFLSVKRTFVVQDTRVIPQPFGTILNEILDDDGNVVFPNLASGRIGVIDIGSKTTNILSVTEMSDISRLSSSIDRGMWDVVRTLKPWLHQSFGLDLRDHEISAALSAGYVKAFGKKEDISVGMDVAVRPILAGIKAEVARIWGKGAAYDHIFITGGGSFCVGKYIAQMYEHSTIVKDPVFSNALGYYKLAVKIGSVNGRKAA